MNALSDIPRRRGKGPRYDVGSTVGPFLVLKQTDWKAPNGAGSVSSKKQYHYVVRCLACGNEKQVGQNVLWYAENRGSYSCRACPPAIRRKLKSARIEEHKPQKAQPTEATLWRLAISGRRCAGAAQPRNST